MRSVWIIIVVMGLVGAAPIVITPQARADQSDKPKVAVFPIGGTADADVREKVAFSFRQKLDRQGKYQPIDGPTMSDVANGMVISFSTGQAEVEKLAAASDEASSAVVLLWGELDDKTLKLHVLDKRTSDATPRDYEKQISQPTDLRFAVENVLESFPGAEPFSHPSETSLTDDAAAKALFASNPNLVQHGDFEGDAASDAWDVLLRSEKYHPPVGELPDPDQVAIVKNPDGDGQVLAMNLSKDVAESNGLACISQSISIQPHKRYRLQFRYRSDAPTLHVFVKGYGQVNDAGENEPRQLYTRQVPPSGSTNGKWVTITDDLNPQHGQYTVSSLRIDLYAYLKPGRVFFDDVVLKDVGTVTHIVKDDGVKSSPNN